MVSYRGDSVGTHTEVDLYSEYERFIKETRTDKQAYRYHLLKAIGIACVMVIVGFVLSVFVGVGAVVVTTTVAVIICCLAISSKKSVIEEQQALRSLWENKPLPIKNTKEIRIKRFLRVVLYTSFSCPFLAFIMEKAENP